MDSATSSLTKASILTDNNKNPNFYDHVRQLLFSLTHWIEILILDPTWLAIYLSLLLLLTSTLIQVWISPIGGLFTKIEPSVITNIVKLLKVCELLSYLYSISQKLQVNGCEILWGRWTAGRWSLCKASFIL